MSRYRVGPGRFKPGQRQAVQERLGLPAKLRRDAVPRTSSLPIEEVRELLDLPEPSCRTWLRWDRWMLGGAALHWLCGGFGTGEEGPHDYDLYFPSFAALNHAISDLLSSGFTFLFFHLWGDTCPFCGEKDGLAPVADVRSGFKVPRARCAACESAGRIAEWGTGRELTQERIARNGLISVDLLSPAGEVFQLAAIAFEPTAQRMMATFDWSICQMGIDDENVYFGPHAWTDLLLGRMRLENGNRGSYDRMGKYRGRGFRPYLDSRAELLWHAVYRRLVLGRTR